MADISIPTHRPRAIRWCAIALASLVMLGVVACGRNPTAGTADGVPVVATVTLEMTTTKTLSTTHRMAPPTVTVPGVTQTVTAPAPATVLVTMTVSANAPTPDPGGPKNDGNYIIGPQITPGTWQCAEPETAGLIYWKVADASGGLMDNGLNSIAYVPAGGSSVLLDDCKSTWTLVG